jgi:molybdate transport system substrate-binding protein
MSTPLHLISSKATQGLLADLLLRWHAQGGAAARVESVGGVDAARRVAAGEAFDGVVLARDALDQLAAAGHVQPGSQVDLVRSGVSVAVPAGAPQPDIGSAAALKAAVLAAASIGYSTGPSGTALLALFAQWGLADTLAPRLKQAPAGVPVGRLVAQGDVALGFQQTSELLGVAGITLLGPLPAEVQITTIFSAGRAASGTRAEATAALLAYLAAPEHAALKRQHGMEAA